MRNVMCKRCRWLGERRGDNADLGPLPFGKFYQQLKMQMEAKPCPQCGGNVRVFRDPVTGRWLP